MSNIYIKRDKNFFKTEVNASKITYWKKILSTLFLLEKNASLVITTNSVDPIDKQSSKQHECENHVTFLSRIVLSNIHTHLIESRHQILLHASLTELCYNLICLLNIC